jgi:hypothetical protein
MLSRADRMPANQIVAEYVEALRPIETPLSFNE